MLFYDDKYYTFSQICPHNKGGRLQANSSDGANKFRCDEHTTQTFDRTGISNESQTNTNVALSQVNVF